MSVQSYPILKKQQQQHFLGSDLFWTAQEEIKTKTTLNIHFEKHK